MLQHLKAANQIERLVRERDVENAGRDELRGRIHLLRHLDRMRIEIEAGQLDVRDPLHDQIRDEALTATGIKECHRIDVRDLAQQRGVEPLDQACAERDYRSCA